MILKLNNQKIESDAKTIAELLSDKSIETKGIAIALNGSVVPRTMWSSQGIKENDEIVVVSAVYGG